MVAAVASALTGLIIYALFSSGFGRIARPAEEAPPPLAVAGEPTRVPTSVAARVSGPRATTLAVVSDDFWLTYLPPGLERSGGGVIEPGPGIDGGWARFGGAERFVEVQVEQGIVAADWQSYRSRVTVLDARDTTVRGRPAAVGRHPNGGRVIVWLERVGTGAWIRVSESLSGELVAVAASVKAPVGD